MANPSLNSFAQAPIQGQMDLRFNPAVVSCVVDQSSAGGLVPGQAVKIVDNFSKVPSVVECALNSDDVFGFLNYNIKNQTFEKGMAVEVSALRDNVMYMTASAAIARNAKVAIVVAGSQVVTATSGMTIVGRALDKAAGLGSLIRVAIDLPGTTA